MNEERSVLELAVVAVCSVVAVLTLVVGLLLGTAAVWKEYSRYQRRADANNRVKVTHINIRNAQEQANVVVAEIAATRARADKRYHEAIGIRRAQDEIAKTLTPLYVQHEAIQAQTNMNKGDRIYIPVGAQGVPLVSDVAKR